MKLDKNLTILFFLTGLLFNSAEAGLFDTVKKVGGGVLNEMSSALEVKAPPIITNIQYVGESDDIWAEKNNYPSEKMEDFRRERRNWVRSLQDGSEDVDHYDGRFSYGAPSTNLIHVLSAPEGYPVYSICLPGHAVSNVLCKTRLMTRDRYALFLCDDGFFSISPVLLGFAYLQMPDGG